MPSRRVGQLFLSEIRNLRESMQIKKTADDQRQLTTAPPAFEGKGSLVIRVAPSTGWPSLRLRELWGYRELLYFLVWRDIKVRYKQTVLGVLWAVIQPFFTMIVFSIFFGRLAQVPSDGLPYPISAMYR